MHFSRRAARAAAPCALTGLLAVSALLATSAPASAAGTTITPTSNASSLAAALAGPSAAVTGASLSTTPTGTPNGVVTGPLSFFPTDGGSSTALTTGDVNAVDDPNTNVPDDPGPGSDVSNTNSSGPTPGRGTTAYDTSVLRARLQVPASANCLTFDFAFYSEEYKEYVGTDFNDAFIAELDQSTWTTSGSTISAPRNFASGPDGKVISINTTGATAMTPGNAAGTTYDGATPLLSASTPVTPGAHDLFLSIFDQGDSRLDSAVLLDGLTIGYVPDPQTQCVAGAQPKSFDLDLAPASQSRTTGETATLTARLTDVLGGGAPVGGEPVLYTVTGANPGSGTTTTAPDGTAPIAYTGTHTGQDTVTACHDADHDTTCDTGEATASATVDWTNAPPTVSAGDDRTGVEGSPVSLTGSATDPEGGPVTSSWTATGGADVDPGATCAFADTSAPATTVTCTDDGTWTLTLSGQDAQGATASDTAVLVLTNAAPVVTALTVPADPAALGTATTARGTFTDAGSNDAQTASIAWGDGTTSPATVSGGTFSATHTYAAAGVYTVCATVTDDDGGSGNRCAATYTVVYDPSGGFVTGGGTIVSPAGAYAADPSVTGTANFGFVSQYKKGASTPTGNTTFQFSEAGFKFASTSYDYLVVSGSKATYRGSGKVNGAGDYAFTVVANDANKGASTDSFRLKVVDKGTGAVVYDNKAGESDTSSAATALSGGSIVIHS